MPDSIIPISDAQAKAIEEALKTLQGFGGFLQETLVASPDPSLLPAGRGALAVQHNRRIPQQACPAENRVQL